MEIKVSIIVPVYNCANSIERCLKSILNQSYKNIEVIAIDDGSKDESGKICDHMAENDSRLQVVHQENQGVSVARNNALASATGQYVQFVDSDDWLANYATESLVNAAIKNGADLVISDFYRVVGNKVSTKGKIKTKKVFSLQTYADYMIKNPADFYYGVLWNKLYKRSIIEKYNIRMVESLNWCEDFVFNLEYIKYCNIFYALQVPIYYYVKNENSLSNGKINANKIIMMKYQTFIEYNKFYQQILSEEEYQSYKPLIYRYFIEMAKDGGTGIKNVILGRERVSLTDFALKNDSFLLSEYRKKKLYYSLLEPLTYKYNLNIRQLLLFDLLQTNIKISKDDIADILDIPKQQVIIDLQMIEFKNYIKINGLLEDKKNYDITITSLGMKLLNDISSIKITYNELLLSELNNDQQQEYKLINSIIEENIKNQLIDKTDIK